MTNPDLISLLGARSVRTSEPDDSSDSPRVLGELLGFIPIYGPTISGQHHEPATSTQAEPSPAPEVEDEHPWSREKAKQIAYASIGLWGRRTIFNCRREWWDRLRAATTPEEKVTCERMINYISEAIGLHQHERGKALCENNTYADSPPTVPGNRDADDVDRWRNVSLAPVKISGRYVSGFQDPEQ